MPRHPLAVPNCRARHATARRQQDRALRIPRNLLVTDLGPPTILVKDGQGPDGPE